MDFIDTFSNVADMTVTDNGAAAYKNSGNGFLLDLFAVIGALRERDERDISSMWKKARNADKNLADSLILYARSIKEGCGERRTGRILLKELAFLDPKKVERNFETIVNCGRWDDLWILIDTPVEDAMWAFVQEQLKKDVVAMKDNKPISLLAKWLCSINTSSKDTRKIAKRTCQKLGLTEKTYRKTLSKMRAYINILEQKMSAREWEKINFEHVPSIAMHRYTNAFNNRCEESFKQYKEAVKCGKKKVNAGAIFPSEIIRTALQNSEESFVGHSWKYTVELDDIAESQWKALPQYDVTDDVLCVVDTSGSMECNSWQPMSTSIAMGIYFAEHNKNYHNMFINFSSNPCIQKIEDEQSLEEKVNQVINSEWGMSTDLDKTFQLIYDIAVEAKSTPKALLIISDMQINDFASEKITDSITSKWNRKFIEAGLNPIKLIYWNVNSTKNTFLGRGEDQVSYISGYGLSSIKNLSTLVNNTGYEAMKEILSNPAFQWK